MKNLKVAHCKKEPYYVFKQDCPLPYQEIVDLHLELYFLIALIPKRLAKLEKSVLVSFGC